MVDRGCAIPVAWASLPGNTPRAWRRAWPRLPRRLRPAVPAGFTVDVLADRGLDARWLDRRIVRLGWHPFPRVNAGRTVRPTGHAGDAPLLAALLNDAPLPTGRLCPEPWPCAAIPTPLDSTSAAEPAKPTPESHSPALGSPDFAISPGGLVSRSTNSGAARRGCYPPARGEAPSCLGMMNSTSPAAANC